MPLTVFILWRLPLFRRPQVIAAALLVGSWGALAAVPAHAQTEPDTAPPTLEFPPEATEPFFPVAPDPFVPPQDDPTLQPAVPSPDGSTSPLFDDAFGDYRLGPGDTIFVSVQRFPDLSFQATLDLQGNIIVPLQGAVPLGTLTLEQAREIIFQVYSQYVVINPNDVGITLTAQRPVEVTVVGEVTRPGFYPLGAPQVGNALLAAGGSTLNADLREIRIQRTVGSETLERTIDLFTPLKQGEALPDVQLQNGDVVVVPRLDLSRLDEYDRSLVATSTLAQPEIDVRVLNYATGIRGNQGNLGTVQLRNGSRFLDAITRVNVNPDRTNLRSVAVVRFNPELGRAETIEVDALAAINGDITQNIPLENNDVLILDRNAVARITYALDTFTQPFRDILGFLLFFDSITDAADDLFRP